MLSETFFSAYHPSSPIPRALLFHTPLSHVKIFIKAKKEKTELVHLTLQEGTLSKSLKEVKFCKACRGLSLFGP